LEYLKKSFEALLNYLKEKDGRRRDRRNTQKERKAG
jgi:hypothetical protein